MATRTDVLWILPDQLFEEDGFNPRYDFGSVPELAGSIAENGIEQPLKVSRERGTENFIVRSGHRRFQAIQYLREHNEEAYGLLKIPVMVEGKNVSPEQRVFNLIIHNDGKPFTLLEEAIVFDKLVSFGYTPKDIAQKIGKSATHVNNCLLLMGVSAKLKKQIMSGKVSASLVIEELKSAKKSSKEVEDDVDEALEKSAKKKVTKKDMKKSGNSADKSIKLSKLEEFAEALAENDGADPNMIQALRLASDYFKGRYDWSEVLPKFMAEEAQEA